ncbi:MerR family transcriptional regulator [Ramlibacter humi]|uniref:MerR family transcriptional regulator n=1 Tax=Ramlibacter humi TaxID=2530451 RepID=UPI00142FF38F|nr:MerR family transcriptional regulator [Ramlibacter humi]
MLTSKDVLDRTGISRATLNNYIQAGLLPRPEVLPPNPEDGAAPRIGYFPDDTVERIETIQRLKREGWSIARIAAQFESGGSIPPAAPGVRPAPAPAPGSATSPVPPAVVVRPEGLPTAPARRFPAPRLTPVAVLVSTLQDAGELWLQLPAGEYFELVNEIWLSLDRIFTNHGGRHGRHPGEGMVCHFLPQPPGNYLWNALAAAQSAREAMRQINSRWQARKGWDFELCMNTGVDEGQDWLGVLRLVEPPELTVVGGAADHAGQLSRAAREGGIWVTRNLVGKLSAEERARLSYGVPRAGKPSARPVLSSFSRLADLAGLQPHSPLVPPAAADLPVTELLDLNGGPASTDPMSGPPPA